METVGPGPADRVHHRAVAAKLRAISIGQERKLRDRFDAERRAHYARSGPVRPESLNVGAVQKIGLAFRARPGNAEVVLDAVEQVRAALSDLRSRGDTGQ